jgi:hypothetical protein
MSDNLAKAFEAQKGFEEFGLGETLKAECRPLPSEGPCYASLTMVSVSEVAKKLARAHKEADPEIDQIYLVEDPSGSEVRLVEVSKSVGNTGTVMPFRFAARKDLDVPYPSVVVLLSPEELQLVHDRELALPDTWGPMPTLVPIG